MIRILARVPVAARANLVDADDFEGFPSKSGSVCSTASPPAIPRTRAYQPRNSSLFLAVFPLKTEGGASWVH